MPGHARSCQVSIWFHLGQVSDNGSLRASIGSHRCPGNSKAFDSFFDQANLLGCRQEYLKPGQLLNMMVSFWANTTMYNNDNDNDNDNNNNIII